MEKEKYKIIQEIELPKFALIKTEKGNPVFKLSQERKFKCDMGDKYLPVDEQGFELENNEVFYQTIFGWGVIVDKDSFKVLYEPFKGQGLKFITEKEYGDGVFDV